jgi:hypothetical protein
MFKALIISLFLAVTALAGTWIIEGTPSGSVQAEALLVDQTVPQTVSNGTLSVEGKYITTTVDNLSSVNAYISADPAFCVIVDPIYDSGTTFSTISGSVPGNIEVSVSPVILDSSSGYYVIDSDSEDKLYTTFSETGPGTLSIVFSGAGYYRAPTHVLVDITDRDTWNRYWYLADLSQSTLVFSDLTSFVTDYDAGVTFYPSPFYAGGSHSQWTTLDYFVWAKTVDANGTVAYSPSNVASWPTPTMNSMYQLAEVFYSEVEGATSYIVYSYYHDRWTEVPQSFNGMNLVYDDGMDFLHSTDGVTLQAYPRNYGFPYDTTTYASPQYVKSVLFSAVNSAASVVINGDGQIVSRVSDPNTFPPMTVDSQVKVDNLNADLVDGLDPSSFVQSVNVTAPLSKAGGLTAPTLSHLDSNGYKHVPSNGVINQIVKNSGSGTVTWGTVTENNGVLSNVTALVVNPTNSSLWVRMTRDTNGVTSMTENHVSVDTKGYYIVQNGASLPLSPPIYSISSWSFNFWCKGFPTGTSRPLAGYPGHSYMQFTENGDNIDFLYYYASTTKLGCSIPKSSFSSGWNMLTMTRGAWDEDIETTRLYLNGVQVASSYLDTTNYYMEFHRLLGDNGDTYVPNYPIDEVALYYQNYPAVLPASKVMDLYLAGIGTRYARWTTLGNLSIAGYYSPQPKFLFRFNDAPSTNQALNSIGNTLLSWSSPNKVSYYEGEICFSRYLRNKNIISCEGIPTSSVTTVTSSFGDVNFNTLIAGKDIKFTPPRWQDVTVSGVALRNGASSPGRKEVIPGTGVYGTGFDIGDDSDFAGQVQHGAASTNANFPEFYYNPHIHVTAPEIADPNTNATFVLTWQITPVNSNFLGTSISRTGTVFWTVGETNVHKLVSFGSITNNLLQGRDSIIFRGNISRIATPVIGNDVPESASSSVIVDSLDYHFPFDSVGSSAVFGDAP